MSERSKGEQAFSAQLLDSDLPLPTREYRWAAHAVGLGPGIRERLERAGLKDWRFDFAWPCARIASEIEGGIWTRGRHTRGAGYEADCEKYNEAQAAGWKVYRFTTAQAQDGRALEFLRRVL